MEVHAPDHPIHTWRDFFIHIATITIGLLIAIGLEQTVELIHHRHMVKEARENIRHELEINEKQARQNIGYVNTDSAAMQANIETTWVFNDLSRAHKAHLSFEFTWSSFNEAAWTSARDSGALTWMAPDEVQRYADAYNQQTIVNKEAVELFTHQVTLAAPVFANKEDQPLPDQDLHALRIGCAETYMKLTTLAQIIQQLDQEYKDILKH